MKSQRTKIGKPIYPDDEKEVLKHYLLKNAIIEKYNRDESNISKNNKHEKFYT